MADSKGILYLHLFGEVAGRTGVYGLVDVPNDYMPDKFWVEFPKCEPLHLKTLTPSQLLTKFGAWGFRLEAVLQVSSQDATKLATEGCFGLNTAAPTQRPIFCWILCRYPTATSFRFNEKRQKRQGPVEVCFNDVTTESSQEIKKALKEAQSQGDVPSALADEDEVPDKALETRAVVSVTFSSCHFSPGSCVLNLP
ncbi:unnamed protein product [Notodromas monacha]|uniref:Uncharacterized protein n=1 Tax=Notodromas monacha TaxID=399045 RepID=A0A7R9BFV3_9CRUS|nr:unnamed protein product [Notodromas monacha]CAG0914681.1 unnamed protein product [Notodromas monacha]